LNTAVSTHQRHIITSEYTKTIWQCTGRAQHFLKSPSWLAGVEPQERKTGERGMKVGREGGGEEKGKEGGRE